MAAFVWLLSVPIYCAWRRMSGGSVDVVTWGCLGGIIAFLVTRFVPRDWKALEWKWFEPAIACGQQSLEVFCAGVFLAASRQRRQPLGICPDQPHLATLSQLHIGCFRYLSHRGGAGQHTTTQDKIIATSKAYESRPEPHGQH